MNNMYPNTPRDLSANQGNGTITVPPNEDFNTVVFRGSLQQMLSENIGQFAVCEFLIGTSNITIKQGIIYNVGASFLVLFDDKLKRYVLCDIFSLKFVTFYKPGERPINTKNGI